MIARAPNPRACASSASSKPIPSPDSPRAHADQQVDEQARQARAGREPHREDREERDGGAHQHEPSSWWTSKLMSPRLQSSGRGSAVYSVRHPGSASPQTETCSTFGLMTVPAGLTIPATVSVHDVTAGRRGVRRGRRRVRHRRRCAALEAARAGARRAAAREGRGPRRYVVRCPGATSTSARVLRCSRRPGTRTPSTRWRATSWRQHRTPTRRRSALYCEGSVEHFDWLEALGFEFERSFYPERP